MYPSLDKNMINIALDFDEQMQKKFGEDYHWEDHKAEIFPEVLTESAPQNDGQGEDGEGADQHTS